MSTLLITLPHTASHVLPGLPIAEAFVKRGHRVLFHTDPCNAAKVQAAGAELVPMSRRCDVIHRMSDGSSAKVPAWLPKFLRQVLYFRHEVLTMVPDMMAELESIAQREGVDCILGDLFGFGASYAAERLNVPYATLIIVWPDVADARGVPVLLESTPFPAGLIHAFTNFLFPLHRVRQQMGLPARPPQAPAEFFAVVNSRTLNLATCHREFIATEHLQENQLFIGPITDQVTRSTDTPDYGESLEPGTVLILYSTAYKEDQGQFRDVVESVAALGVPVLAVPGSLQNLSLDFPANVRVEEFVHMDEVMPYIRAIVSFAGCGTVGRVFRAGVPALLISDNSDTLPIARRAEELGVAYHLPKHKITRERLHAKLKALLADEALHVQVKALSDQLNAMDPPQEVAAIALEGLLPKAQPSAEVAADTLQKVG
ncbi:MAG: nucleotide disphospho-sugar-binding domain-containing protein [Leptolyngbyaceae cyanobacterium]